MKKSVLIVAIMLLIAVALGAAGVVLAANQNRAVASADDNRLLIPTIPDSESDAGSWALERRQESSNRNWNVRNTGYRRVAQDTEGAKGRPVAKSEGRVVKIIVACIAGLTGICGLALLAYGIWGNRERHVQKVNFTTILAKSAGTRRRRQAPVALPFPGRAGVAQSAVASSNAEDTKELRRAA